MAREGISRNVLFKPRPMKWEGADNLIKAEARGGRQRECLMDKALWQARSWLVLSAPGKTVWLEHGVHERDLRWGQRAKQRPDHCTRLIAFYQVGSHQGTLSWEWQGLVFILERSFFRTSDISKVCKSVSFPFFRKLYRNNKEKIF